MSLFLERCIEEISAWLNASGRYVLLVFFALATLGGLVYPLIFLCVTAKKRVKVRRERRREIERKLHYTLPDKENAFVRTRLNTVLRVEDEPNTDGGENRAEKNFRFEHARKLLLAVKGAELSAAERLETTELFALFELYVKKKEWNATDLRTVNDAFSRVLKLAAKYSVATQ